MKQRKIPMRRCNGCNEQKPKNQLIRIVKSPEDEISLDLTGKKSGRGAYICPSASCLKKAKKRLEASLECKIPDEVFEKLETEIEGEHS